ncbi:juvenile hormone acid O-methyltransferase-like [Diabrotica virgifera virgifera]|uniref:Juvenile hormone acid O-methyltransferase-like n=1 Tax=Diabrotica virgifera virgifera TaxID=50390 RepID=A0A6P7FA66_DIAVI|nr:juvenile hormone acid O-methyltransferase-like [Diabrotica virgifera virgifera]
MISDVWIKGNCVTQILTKQKFEKYGHLLKWKKNESILEFGAADGNTSVNSVLPVLPKDYKEYVLTDISPNMVEHMKKNLNIPRSKIMQHDIGTIRLQDDLKNRFDHIFGIFVMHMVPDPRQGFINIKAMLKPGGQAFVSILERTPMDHAFDALLKYPKWSRYGHMLSPHYYSDNIEEAYKKDIEAAEFESYSFHVQKDYPIWFESEDSRRGLLAGINNVLPRIPEELREEYLKDYHKEIERDGHIKFIERNGEQIPYVDMKLLVAIMNKKE